MDTSKAPARAAESPVPAAPSGRGPDLLGMIQVEDGVYELAPGWRNIVLVTEYDGTRYAGWQRQENARAVQGVLEAALEKLCGHPITLYGSSRTDAGVHALGHVSNFRTRNPIPADRIPLALPGFLPSDIVVRIAAEAPADFNARYHSTAKTYAYHIWNAAHPSALLSRYSCHIPVRLDLDRMQRAARDLIGWHDFSAFRAEGGQTRTSEREIFSAAVQTLPWPLKSGFPPDESLRAGTPPASSAPDFPAPAKEEDRLIRIVVRGSGFLYNMMRIIAGTLVYIGQGKIEEDAIPGILESRNRLLAGKTLPPQGLFLEKVEYGNWFEEIT